MILAKLICSKMTHVKRMSNPNQYCNTSSFIYTRGVRVFQVGFTLMPRVQSDVFERENEGQKHLNQPNPTETYVPVGSFENFPLFECATKNKWTEKIRGFDASLSVHLHDHRQLLHLLYTCHIIFRCSWLVLSLWWLFPTLFGFSNLYFTRSRNKIRKTDEKFREDTVQFLENEKSCWF